MIFETLLLLVAPADPFARARADTAHFCAAKHGPGTKEAKNCEAKQKSELGYFVTMMTGFKDPGNANAKRCMVSGKRGKYIDWTVATPCMRAAVKGRRTGP